MNDYEKIVNILDEHKEHAHAFREDVNSKLTGALGELKQIGRRLDISNGRMAKQEEATQKLREEDIGIAKELSFLKDNGSFIRDRSWTVVTSVVSALIISAIISTVVWIINR